MKDSIPTEEVMLDFGKITLSQRRFFSGIVNRLSAGNMSPAGIDQALSGQIVTNPADRQTLAKLLLLIAKAPVSHILLLLPAVQKVRH